MSIVPIQADVEGGGDNMIEGVFRTMLVRGVSRTMPEQLAKDATAHTSSSWCQARARERPGSR